MDIFKALEHHQAGRLAEAVAIYQQILEADPDNADALHLMGNAALQLGEANLAADLIARAQRLVPGKTAYLNSLGIAYRALERWDESLACFARMLELEPGSASAYFGLGNSFREQGKTDEARQSFLEALASRPDFLEAHYNLGNLEKRLGHFENAVAHYRQALDIRPDFADAYHNLGSALHSLGQLEEALERYRQALRHNPDQADTHNNMGNVHFDLERFAQARDCYERAVACQPDYAVAHNNLGNSLGRLGQPKQAEAAFREALRLQPDYAVAHLNLGHLLQEQERLPEAVEAFERAASRAPEPEEAYFSLGSARALQKDLAGAQAAFEQALALRPDYIDALYNLGVIMGRLQRASEAEHYYREVLRHRPGHIEANINLSALLYDSGRLREAGQRRELAYRQQNLFVRRAPHALRTVLILFDAGKGNLNLTHLFNERNNRLIDWIIEYADEAQIEQLPDYDLVFNAMGDSDITGDTARPLTRFLQRCDRPLLNPPERVARTARHRLGQLLSGIANIELAPVWRLADAEQGREDAQAVPADLYPRLIRPVHTHGGVGMVLAHRPEEASSYLERHSGAADASASDTSAYYVMPFIDSRGADGFYRKYRVIYIDRRPYPYHLAISPHWMVHYYTAEMEAHAWKLEEEKAFLADPEAVLGPAGWAAIEAIGERMDLDYAGLDFTQLADGRILVFEANPTMLAHPEAAEGPLAHKNPYVTRIFAAFEALLDRSVVTRT